MNINILLNSELANVNDLLKLSKLSLDVKKCKYMISHTSRKKVNSLQLEIADVKIERVQDFNFVGITLNENLNWKSVINKISNTISKSMGILNKLKYKYLNL